MALCPDANRLTSIVMREPHMQKKIIVILTLMLVGRAMTLAFIHRVGGPNPDDPPVAWLMPLIGDAVVGITGLAIAYLLVTRTGLFVWAAVVVWNVVAIWDAMSAFIIHNTNPWPEFFMIQIFGPAMFFAASAMHLVIVYLVSSKELMGALVGSDVSLFLSLKSPPPPQQTPAAPRQTPH